MQESLTVEKYQTSTEAEMSGQAMQAFTIGLMADDIAPFLDDILADYGVSEIHPEEWYPAQMALDLYRKLVEQAGNSTQSLISIGMAFVETAQYPPEVDTLEKALNLLNAGYEMSIRHYPEHEGYTVQVMSDDHIRVIDHCPYPHNIVYGYIYGMAKQFSPEGIFPVVERTYAYPDDPDSGGATYDITLE